MRYYKTTTEFNCGIDLHSRCMYICVVDKEGNVLVHKNIKRNDFSYFLRLVAPYRHDLTVACESTFNWYWLADACDEADIKFVLGHALYMKAIHGGKKKNDKIDSEKIAHLLRTNMIPIAYVYPAKNRPVRGLLRRRTYFVWKRAELLAHLSMGVMVEGQQPLSNYERRRSEREESLLERYTDPMHRLSVKADMYLVKHHDITINELEQAILEYTRNEHSRDYNILKTAPGLGKITGLLILYEVDTIKRFERVQDFCSYSRLVKGSVESAGKIYSTRGAKIGNAYLKWAFSEIAIHCKRHNPYLRKYAQKLENKYGKHVANAIMAHKMGKAVYYMLRDSKGFDVKKFVGDKVKIK
jgi:transposase